MVIIIFMIHGDTPDFTVVYMDMAITGIRILDMEVMVMEDFITDMDLTEDYTADTEVIMDMVATTEIKITMNKHEGLQIITEIVIHA